MLAAMVLELTGTLHSKLVVLIERHLRVSVVICALGPGNQETRGLAWRNAVEGDKANIRFWKSPFTRCNFLQHLAWFAAAEHGQLPQSPVAIVVVTLHCIDSSCFGQARTRFPWHSNNCKRDYIVIMVHCYMAHRTYR